jgi:hypothetical protein
MADLEKLGRKCNRNQGKYRETERATVKRKRIAAAQVDIKAKTGLNKI